jgi:hypothetical protein
MSSTVNIRENLNNLVGQGGSAVQYDLGIIIGSFVNVAILVGAIASLIFMIMGAIQWITAGGDTGKIDKARAKFVQSIVGLAVVASTYAIFLVVQYFFGINVAVVPNGSGGAGNGGPGAGGGAPVCTVGQTANAGSVGNYCNGGSTRMKCVAAGSGPSSFIEEAHWEPCQCISGTPRSGVTFVSCN